MAEEKIYGVSEVKEVKQIPVPELSYRPPLPSRNFNIALIGAGGIAEAHLSNYKKLGWKVVGISSRQLDKAKGLAKRFYPEAATSANYEDFLNRPDIDVVDITTPPEPRVEIIRKAITAGKHVLSQKPFVLDLAVGRELIALAKSRGVLLAVNQNGRWAPHFSWIRNAIRAGLVGRVTSVDFFLQWDQTFIKSTPFNQIPDLLLSDFGIHWFDILNCFMSGERPESIYASLKRFEGQQFSPSALGHVVLDYAQAQARIAFNAHTLHGEQDVTVVVGTEGTIRSSGRGLNEQTRLEYHHSSGSCVVPLEGSWFEEGFQGTMGELLSSIEAKRAPYHEAESTLLPLEMVFASLRSAAEKRVVSMEEDFS